MASVRVIIKKLIPNSVLNSTLLTFPFLYRLPVVRYETNIGLPGLNTLIKELEKVVHLEGSIIECGASRCGTTAVMARFLKSQGINKHIYALDSFEGFPKDEVEQEKTEGLSSCQPDEFTSTSIEYVTKKMHRLGVGEYVTPVKGFFQDTLASLDHDWCFAFVDCDLRDSLLYCAELIWPRLVSGGCIIFDDYNNQVYRGARVGVDHFVSKYKAEIGEHHNNRIKNGARGYVVYKL